MELTRASDIIEYCYKSDKYLNCGNDYLCGIILNLSTSIATEEAAKRAQLEVKRSLGGYTFLRSVFTVEGKFTGEDSLSSPKYKALALPYWASLVTKLRSEGK